MKKVFVAVFVCCLLVVVVIYIPQEVDRTNAESLVQVGDQANQVKLKISEWGWQTTNFAWAYGIVEWQGSAEATTTLAEKESTKLREENDFNDQPYFYVGSGKDRSVVCLRAENGVVTRISKGRKRNDDWTWENGYKRVSRDGVFER